MITELSTVLNNRKWERYSNPFPFVCAGNVFKPRFYEGLEKEYREVLDRGVTETPKAGMFCRNMPGYDAYGTGLTAETTGNMEIFTSWQWHDMMASLFGVRGTNYINAGFHHHKVDSANGFIHNDLNPVWFPIAGEGRIRFPGHGNCSYKNGAGPLAPDEKIEVVRGVVMIFYLANDPWKPGDGGETGLYTTHSQDVEKPTISVPPYNNSLVIYECTAQSWHSFIKNKKSERNSVIMWIHRSMEDATERWNPDQFERWKS